jgi:hypothetical protein
VNTVFTGHPDRYPTVELLAVAETQPDVVLLPTEPYPFTERHAPELREALGVPVHVVDGKDLFWWGVRTGPALDRFSELAQRLAEKPSP